MAAMSAVLLVRGLTEAAHLPHSMFKNE
jgi:hypothetical protein